MRKIYQVYNHIFMWKLISQLGPKRHSFAGPNIGNPIDPRRTRSDFQRVGISLSFHDSFLSETCYLMIGSDPKSYYHPWKDTRWQDAMDREFNSLRKNATWELVSLPHGRKLVQFEWVFWKKVSTDGTT